MRDELDKALVEKHPSMFKNRYAPMTETCMCWGFECGDGWYDILRLLCDNIEHHVKWKREMRARDIRLNRAIKRGREALTTYMCGDKFPNSWQEERIDYLLEHGSVEVTPKVHRVTVDQVKEKFGTLRFYYQGGDEYVSGLARMAESMTAITCEQCGAPAQTRHGGWVRTLCDAHEEEYQNRWKNMKDEDE